jgi:hypothetical protein
LDSKENKIDLELNNITSIVNNKNNTNNSTTIASISMAFAFKPINNTHPNTNINNTISNNQKHSKQTRYNQKQENFFDNDNNHIQEQDSKFIKELNKEERLRLVREKRELELAKRKKEIEDNLKRKQELREKQIKERQRRIFELKLKETERRAAVEERRRQRDEMARVLFFLFK